MGKCCCLWVWIAICLAPVAARAQDAEPALGPGEAALFANRVHDEHCANTGAADREVAGLAMEKVAPAYRKVATSYRTHGSAYLLYWRGLLAQCLSLEEEAAEDLQAFVTAMADNSEYGGQIKDARRRLRQLGQRPSAGGGGTAPRWLPGLGVQNS